MKVVVNVVSVPPLLAGGEGVVDGEFDNQESLWTEMCPEFSQHRPNVGNVFQYMI